MNCKYNEQVAKLFILILKGQQTTGGARNVIYCQAFNLLTPKKAAFLYKKAKNVTFMTSILC